MTPATHVRDCVTGNKARRSIEAIHYVAIEYYLRHIHSIHRSELLTLLPARENNSFAPTWTTERALMRLHAPRQPLSSRAV